MSHPDEQLDPDPRGSVEAIADELFVHGLLRSRALDDPASQGRRIAALLGTLDGALDGARPRRRLVPLPWLGLGAAAAVLIVALLGWLFAGDDAGTRIDSAIAAARQAGARRYLVEGWLAGEPAAVMRGELDARDQEHYVLRATLHGMPITIGAGGQEQWSVGDDRIAAHLRSGPGGLPAFEVHGDRLGMGSIDALLPRLRAEYSLESRGSASLAGHAGEFFHILARRSTAAALPDTVETWIDERSGQAQRIELRWHGTLARPDSRPTGPRIVLELIGAVALPDDWFRAERHKR